MLSLAFLVKHLRPITEDGFNTYASPQLMGFLVYPLGFDPAEMVVILDNWRTTALADPIAQSDLFVEAAEEVSQARWTELGLTTASTLLFLNSEQLADLSRAGADAGPDTTFAWEAPGPIAIAVTIHRHSGAHHVIWDAWGCQVATDAESNVNHFDGVIANQGEEAQEVIAARTS